MNTRTLQRTPAERESCVPYLVLPNRRQVAENATMNMWDCIALLGDDTVRVVVAIVPDDTVRISLAVIALAVICLRHFLKNHEVTDFLSGAAA